MKTENGTFSYQYNIFCFLTKVNNDKELVWKPTELNFFVYSFPRNASGYLTYVEQNFWYEKYYYNELNQLDSVYHHSYDSKFGISYLVKNEFLNGNLQRSYFKYGLHDSIIINYEYNLNRLNLVDFGLKFWPGFSIGIIRTYFGFTFLSPDKNVFKRMKMEKYRDKKLLNGYIEEVVEIKFDNKGRTTKYVIGKSTIDSLGDQTFIGTKTIDLEYFD